MKKKAIKEQADEVTIEYPEALGELGAMLRILQDVVAPYCGEIRLRSMESHDGSLIDVTDLAVDITVQYDPRLFHHAIVAARQQAGLG
jgi:hypothetical protein